MPTLGRAAGLLSLPKRNDYAAAIEDQSSSCQDDYPGYSISRVPYIGDTFSDTNPFGGLCGLV